MEVRNVCNKDVHSYGRCHQPLESKKHQEPRIQVPEEVSENEEWIKHQNDYVRYEYFCTTNVQSCQEEFLF